MALPININNGVLSPVCGLFLYLNNHEYIGRKFLYYHILIAQDL